MTWQLKLEQWASPRDAPPIQRRNFLFAQLEGIGISFANAASPFLAVFLARLGATNFQVGLLSAMPAFTGLVLAIALGRLLQRQRQIVPWYAWGRFLSIIAFAGMALAAMILPGRFAIVAVLAIWAVSTLPQTVVSIAFSVVMNAVAGPDRRYDLLSRRWSLMGLITAIAMAIATPFLAAIVFPLNYQLLFIVASVGGFIAVYFSLKIKLPEPTAPPNPSRPGGAGKIWCPVTQGGGSRLRGAAATARQARLATGLQIFRPYRTSVCAGAWLEASKRVDE